MRECAFSSRRTREVPDRKQPPTMIGQVSRARSTSLIAERLRVEIVACPGTGRVELIVGRIRPEFACPGQLDGSPSQRRAPAVPPGLYLGAIEGPAILLARVLEAQKEIVPHGKRVGI